MKWTEGIIHIALRFILREKGWLLIAGEFPGGSDHELYALNIVDTSLARDDSPDPRRHSFGELVPDIVALKNRTLLIGEAKVTYNYDDERKLLELVSTRRAHLMDALRKFATERSKPELYPLETLLVRPTLIFVDSAAAPTPRDGLSHLRITSRSSADFVGDIDSDNT